MTAAAVDRTRWARRPLPHTLDEIAAIARRGNLRLHAAVQLPGTRADVYFDGCMLRHARVGWALGHRALMRLLEAEPFEDVQLQRHVVPELLTIERSWLELRAELGWASRCHTPIVPQMQQCRVPR